MRILFFFFFFFILPFRQSALTKTERATELFNRVPDGKQDCGGRGDEVERGGKWSEEVSGASCYDDCGSWGDWVEAKAEAEVFGRRKWLA